MGSRWGRDDPTPEDEAEVDKSSKGMRPEGREKEGRVPRSEKPAIKKHYEEEE